MQLNAFTFRSALLACGLLTFIALCSPLRAAENTESRAYQTPGGAPHPPTPLTTAQRTETDGPEDGETTSHLMIRGVAGFPAAANLTPGGCAGRSVAGGNPLRLLRRYPLRLGNADDDPHPSAHP